MLFKIILLALAGAALAEYNHDYHHGGYDDGHYEHEYKYHGPPAPLKHDGTVDYTPEVKHARAAHFAALQAYKSSFPQHGYSHQYHGNDHYNDHYDHYSHPVPYSHFFNHNPAPVKHDGSVDDLPEVKAARAAHLAEYSKALYRHRRSFDFGAPLKHDGTVDETPEVKHARAEHFAALAQASSHTPYHAYSHHGYHHYEPAPLNHDGTVADTDDIKHAKAILYKAHSEAKARLHSSPYYGDHYSSHYDHDHYPKYHGPPAPLNHDGTVAETPEVKHAKAVHFHLYSQALHRYKRAVPFQPAPLNPDGTVAETPEIQQAKAAFFAAHEAEMAKADRSWVEPQYDDEPHHEYQPIHYSFPTKPVYEHSHRGSSFPQHFPQSSFPQHFPKSSFPSFTPSHSFSPSPSHGYSYSPSHLSQSFNHHVVPAPLNHDGTVADTPEIKAAKAVHFAAHQEALAKAGPQKYPHHYF